MSGDVTAQQLDAFASIRALEAAQRALAKVEVLERESVLRHENVNAAIQGAVQQIAALDISVKENVNRIYSLIWRATIGLVVGLFMIVAYMLKDTVEVKPRSSPTQPASITHPFIPARDFMLFDDRREKVI